MPTVKLPIPTWSKAGESISSLGDLTFSVICAIDWLFWKHCSLSPNRRLNLPKDEVILTKSRGLSMSFQDRRCDKCAKNSKYIYSICSDCSLTICIYCLSDTSWIVQEPPPECPECNSARFFTVDESPPFLIP